MFAHNSAAYHPTLMQCSQMKLLGLIEGCLSSAFFPKPSAAPASVASRERMRAAGVNTDAEKKEQTMAAARKRKAMWAKQEEIDEPKKKPRLEKKRTVFTKDKQSPVRRKPAASDATRARSAR